MKILYLITDLFGGGAEKQLSYLALGMAKYGHEVHIGCQYNGDRVDLINKYNKAKVKVHRLAGKFVADPYILPHVLRLIRSEKFDLIQTCIRKMDVIGGIISPIVKVPWILREANCAEKWEDKRFASIRSKLAHFATCIVSNSNVGDRYWESVYPHKQRYVIYNGFPIESIKRIYTAHDSSVSISEAAPYILYAGRLEKHKNVSVLVEAFSRLRQDNVALVIAGEGPLRQELEAQVSNRDLKNVRLVGRQSSEGLWQLMKEASCLALLSDYEGFPNVTAEAAILECPLLLSDIQSHRDLWGEDAAKLVDQHDTESVVAGVKEMLDNSNLREKLRANASKKAAMFTVEKMVQSYLEVYTNII